MNIRLMCLKNPRALGIVDGTGHVHIERLEEHVRGCADCKPFFKPAILDLLRKLIRQPRLVRPSAGARAI
ncbi:MAG: hypothetical protein ABFD81_03150 [Syntrophaceae bacterium]